MQDRDSLRLIQIFRFHFIDYIHHIDSRSGDDFLDTLITTRPRVFEAAGIGDYRGQKKPSGQRRYRVICGFDQFPDYLCSGGGVSVDQQSRFRPFLRSGPMMIDDA